MFSSVDDFSRGGQSTTQAPTTQIKTTQITITLQRAKCIGCDYCREAAPDFFAMSHKDGKSILVHAQARKGFDSRRVQVSVRELAGLRRAESACPVRIIAVREQQK